MVEGENAAVQGSVPAEGQTETNNPSGLPGNFATAEEIYQELLKKKEQYENLEKKLGEQGNELGKFRAIANNYPAELIAKAIESVGQKQTPQEEVSDEILEDPKKLNEFIEKKATRIAEGLFHKEMSRYDSLASLKSKPQFDKLESSIKGIMAIHPDVTPEVAYRYALGQMHEEELTRNTNSPKIPPIQTQTPKMGSMPGAPTTQISPKPNRQETSAELRSRLERESGVKFGCQ